MSRFSYSLFCTASPAPPAASPQRLVLPLSPADGGLGSQGVLAGAPALAPGPHNNPQTHCLQTQMALTLTPHASRGSPSVLASSSTSQGSCQRLEKRNPAVVDSSGQHRLPRLPPARIRPARGTVKALTSPAATGSKTLPDVYDREARCACWAAAHPPGSSRAGLLLLRHPAPRLPQPPDCTPLCIGSRCCLRGRSSGAGAAPPPPSSPCPCSPDKAAPGRRPSLHLRVSLCMLQAPAASRGAEEPPFTEGVTAHQQISRMQCGGSGGGTGQKEVGRGLLGSGPGPAWASRGGFWEVMQVINS